MVRWIIPPCLAVVIQAWVSTELPRSRLLLASNAKTAAWSRVFHDDECFDLCPSDEDEDGLAASPRQPPAPDSETETVSVLEDEQCLDLCPMDEIEQGTPAPTEPPREMTTQDEEWKVDRDRIRLEMAYELFESKDDCDLDNISTCASPCDNCHGVGTKPCRFCMGSKSISLHIGATTQEMPCSVCDQKGVEVCSKCRGSGQVAAWTYLANFDPGNV